MERIHTGQNQGAGVVGTEGGRSPTGVPTTPAAAAVGPPPAVPNPEVPEKPVRRRFTAEYKQRILQEADRCAGPGQCSIRPLRPGVVSFLDLWQEPGL